MMNLEANIFPLIEIGEDDIPNLERIRTNLLYIEESLIKSPLGQSPVVTLGRTEFDNGMEHSTGVLDSYQFIITRRYKLHGEWHVGGANGEILNVYTFISGYRAFLEEQIELRDSQS